MAVLKDDNLKVEGFAFRQLLPGDEAGEDTDSFEFKSLNTSSNHKNNISESDIRLERKAADEKNFNFLESVNEHRGLNRQRKEDYEKEVSTEVERRIQKLGEDAYQEGLEKGLREGRDQAYQEAKKELEEKLDEFTEHIAATQGQIDQILTESKLDIYNIVKNLTKWIILKDVDEKYYLSRLLEKLIHEVNQKNNLVLHVNEGAFGYMPDIIKLVERKVGVLNNIRVEVDLDLKENGIKLETENCIVDGSMQAQFEALDELFTSVGLNSAS